MIPYDMFLAFNKNDKYDITMSMMLPKNGPNSPLLKKPDWALVILSLPGKFCIILETIMINLFMTIKPWSVPHMSKVLSALSFELILSSGYNLKSYKNYSKRLVI